MVQEVIPPGVRETLDALTFRQRQPTPFILIDLDEVCDRAKLLQQAAKQSFPRSKFFYSYKTNNLARLAREISKLGFGAEVASMEEMISAEVDGTASNGLIFDGPLKQEHELLYAMQRNCVIHLDSLQEAKSAAKFAVDLGSRCKAKFGVRLAHRYKESYSRFGFTPTELHELDTSGISKRILIEGIHIHTGSNLADIHHFIECFNSNKYYIDEILNRQNSWIDVGGGFPANSKRIGNNYDALSMMREYGSFLRERINIAKIDVFFEPGRYLVEDSGYMVSQINHCKRRDGKHIAICDAGLNMVSSVKSWQHSAEVLRHGPRPVLADVYGSNCFESDLIWRDLEVNDQEASQYFVIRGCGGYDIPSTNFWLRSATSIWLKLGGGLTCGRSPSSVENFRPRDVVDV